MGHNLHSCCGGPSAEDRDNVNFNLSFEEENEGPKQFEVGNDATRNRRLDSKKSSFMGPVPMPSHHIIIDGNSRNNQSGLNSQKTTLKPAPNPAILQNYDEDLGRPRNSHVLSESNDRNSIIEGNLNFDKTQATF
jgi:hypothetical protein